MPWDVMPKWWVSDKDLFTLLCLDADWAWRGATPKTVVSQTQGGLVDTYADGLAFWVRELTISPYTHPRESGYAPYWPAQWGVNYIEKHWGSARYCDCVAVRGYNPVAGAAVHGNSKPIIKFDFESTRGKGVLKFYAALLRNRVSEISRQGGRGSAGRGDGTSDSNN